MFRKLHLDFFTWPDWIRLLLLVLLTVTSLTIAVLGLSWLLNLLN